MESSTPRDNSPARVLVVDDNLDVLHTTVLLIRTMGHEVRAVATGPTALEEVKPFAPDLILLDIAMPKMDGLQVAKSVRNLSLVKEPVLAALTGFGTADIKDKCVETGFDHFLLKPVDAVALDQLIQLTRGVPRPQEALPTPSAKYQESVYAFARSQLEFFALMLNASAAKPHEKKERQFARVEGALQRITGWLERQALMRDNQKYQIQEQVLKMKYRLALIRKEALC